MYSLDNSNPLSDTSNGKNEDKFYIDDPGPFDTLKRIKTSNLNRLNINSLRNKFTRADN